MASLRQILTVKRSRASFDVRVAQVASLGCAPLVLLLALRGVARFAVSPGEILLGVLSASALSLLLVILGLILTISNFLTEMQEAT